MDPSLFLTHTLNDSPRGAAARRILAAALEAVDPEQAVRAALRLEGNRLWVGERGFDLSGSGRVWVVGAGKAGAPMTRAAWDLLGARIAGGLVITKSGHVPPGSDFGPIEVVEAAHPVPDERGVQHTRRLLEMAGAAGPEDLVVCLISGGGSALLTAPAAGLSLADLQELTGLLLRSGAPIDQINSLRKHLDEVKGGGLLRQIQPARAAALILSDVVGDPLDAIASGPTVPDPSTYSDALDILNRWNLLDQAPPAVRRAMEEGARGERPETLKPGELPEEGMCNLVVASNVIAARAAFRQAEQEGYQPVLLTTHLEGEAREAGRFLAGLARSAAGGQSSLPRPLCLIAGGETTVTVRGSGLGGRNQELALGAVRGLADLPGVTLITLATDGGDGPTGAAGAVVTGDTLARAAALGLDPTASLAANDAYHFFEPLGDLLRPGPTRTNVNDLSLVFVD